MADRKKNPRLTTPRGILKYPRVNGTPDTKFNKEGSWTARILFEPEGRGVQEFLKKLDSETDAAVAAMKVEHKKFSKQITRGEPYRNEVDGEGEETGKIEFGASRDYVIHIKNGPKAGQTFNTKIALFDAFGKPITKELKIGGGTEAKLTFEYYPYFAPNDKKAGISRRLLAVQIIKLVEWGSGDAKSFGFGEEDDGFSVNEIADTGSSDADDEDDTEDSDDESQSGSDF